MVCLMLMQVSTLVGNHLAAAGNEKQMATPKSSSTFYFIDFTIYYSASLINSALRFSLRISQLDQADLSTMLAMTIEGSKFNVKLPYCSRYHYVLEESILKCGLRRL